MKSLLKENYLYVKKFIKNSQKNNEVNFYARINN